MSLPTVQQLAMASIIDDGPGVENQHDLSDLDVSEAERESLFFTNGCGCKLGPKNASCSSVISKELAVQCTVGHGGIVSATSFTYTPRSTST